MYQELFQELGLSPNEAKIYESLLTLKEAAVGEISSNAKIHRRNVYDALNRLVDKGLVFPILAKRENKYAPVDPNKFSELLEEKEQRLNKAMPDLKEMFSQSQRDQEAYIYRGLEGIKNYMRDILRVSKDIYTLGGNLSWQDPDIKSFSEQMVKQAIKKGIKFKLIFYHEVKEKGKEQLVKMFGEPSNYRFLPKEFNSGSAIDIFGDYVVSFSGLSFMELDDNVTIFVVKDSGLAESYRLWHKFMWDNAEKM